MKIKKNLFRNSSWYFKWQIRFVVLCLLGQFNSGYTQGLECGFRKDTTINQQEVLENLLAPENNLLLADCTAGYFDIMFDDVPEELHATICKVFEDLSSEIILRENNTLACGDVVPTKNILIVINSNSTFPDLGGATTYTAPARGKNNCKHVEVGVPYKSINGGTGDQSQGGIDLYLAGSIALLPYPENNPAPYNFPWHTDWTVDAPNETYDLYSLILHEALHILGFASNILENGQAYQGHYSLWDTHLFGLENYDPNNSNPNADPILESNCPTNCWNLNSSLFPNVSDFQNALENHCTAGGNFDFVFGENALAPLRQPGAVNSLNALSHLSNTCNGLLEDFVMRPTFEDGYNNRTISETELLILCELGYKTPICDGCYTTPETDWGEASASYLNCCTPVFYFCPSDDVQQLSHDLLLCNDTHNASAIEITDVFPHNSTPSTVTINNTGTEFEILAPIQGTFGFYYTVKGCDCKKMVNQYFEITVGPCLDCNGVDECDNLICTDGFEEFSPYSYFPPKTTALHYELNGEYWHYVGGSNQPELCNDSPTDNNFVVLNHIRDGLSFKLQEPILPGCTGTIELLAGGRIIGGNETIIEVHGSEFPPCTATDIENNQGCVPTSCTVGQAFSPFCFGEIPITNLQQNSAFCPINPDFISYTLDFPNVSNQPINNIILRLANASTSVWMDDIVITQTCAFPEFEFTVDCSQLEVTFSNLKPSPNGVHLWDFGDGTTSTESDPVHIYANLDQYTVTHTVFDACGQSSQSQSVLIEECPIPFCNPCGTSLDIDATGGVPFLDTPIANFLSPFTISDGVRTTYFLNGPVCLSILGQLIIEDNQGLILNGGDVRMESGAEILVEGMASLNIQESHLYGCEDLWRSITVEDGGIISLKDSHIEDAQFAVRMNGSGNLNLRDNIFENNEVGIYAANNNVSKRISSFLDGNRFTISDALLDPFSGYILSSPFTPTGIVLYESFFTIGSDQDNSLINTFDHLACGIEAFGGYLTVNHTLMSDFIAPDIPAIFAHGIKVEDVFFGATSNTITQDDTEEPIFFHVRASGGHMSLVENTFESIGHGGQILFQNGTYPNSPYVYDNQITSSTFTLRNGLIEHRPIINKNTFDNSALSVSNTNAVSGISGPYGQVKDNTFNQGSIRLVDANYLQLYDNQVTLNDGTLLGLSASNNLKIKDNSLKNALGTVSQQVGIRNFGSHSNDYCCNSFENIDEGLRFSGMCNPIQLKQSRFMTGEALICEGGTILGPQTDFGNRWDVEGEAFHLGTDPEKFLSAFFIQDGIPFTTTLDKTLPFWPNPSVDPNWFFGSESFAGTCETECGPPLFPFGENPPESESPKITENDKFTVTTKFSESIYSAMLNWESEKNLYQKLKTFPQLLEQDSDIVSFYNEMQGTNLATLNDVQSLYETAYLLNDAWKNSLQTIQDNFIQYTEEISEMDALLATATGEDSLSLLAQKELALQEIQIQYNAATEILQDIETNRLTQLAVALQLNATISPNSIFEENEKAINAIYLATMAKGILTLDEDQFATVSNIAHQCFKEGGHIVLKARMLYNLKEEKDFNDGELCSLPETKRQAENVMMDEDVKISLYPNPAQEEVTIQINVKGMDKIYLYSILGEKVFEQTLSGDIQTLNIKVGDLADGLYLCSVFGKETTIQSKKLMINH